MSIVDPAVELQEVIIHSPGLASFSQQETPTRRWHPRLIGYHILVLTLTGVLGSCKAAFSLRGDSVATITTEWVLGVVVFVGLYYLSLYEEENSQALPWLFEKSYTPYILRLFCLRSNPLSSYETIERDTTPLSWKQYPPLTGYRIIVSATVIGPGLFKAILAYKGYSTTPTIVEWIFGVLVTMGLYWLGLYEKSPRVVFPVLFDTDYTEPAVLAFLHADFKGFQGPFFRSLWYLLLHVLAMVLSIGWADMWLHNLIEFSTESNNDPHTSLVFPRSGFETVSKWFLKLVDSVGQYGLPAYAGLIAWFLATPWSARVAASSLRRFSSQMIPSTFQNARAFLVRIFVLGYVLIHAFGMFARILWSLVWVYGFAALWKSIVTGDKSVKLVLLVALVAAFPIGVGLVGCFFVYKSLLAPFSGGQLIRRDPRSSE